MHRRLMPALLLVAVIGGGCSSRYFKIAPQAPASFEALGPVSAEHCGVYLFGIFSVGANDRFERAYYKAVASAPGARALQDVEVSDRWASLLVFGTQWCATVSGTAIR